MTYYEHLRAFCRDAASHRVRNSHDRAGLKNIRFLCNRALCSKNLTPSAISTALLPVDARERCQGQLQGMGAVAGMSLCGQGQVELVRERQAGQ